MVEKDELVPWDCATALGILGMAASQLKNKQWQAARQLGALGSMKGLVDCLLGKPYRIELLPSLGGLSVRFATQLCVLCDMQGRVIYRRIC